MSEQENGIPRWFSKMLDERHEEVMRRLDNIDGADGKIERLRRELLGNLDRIAEELGTTRATLFKLVGLCSGISATVGALFSLVVRMLGGHG